jgi:hypothetical protein
MIIAKTEKGLAHFKQLFDEKTLADTDTDKEQIQLKKFYKATCHLTPEGESFLDSITAVPYTIKELVHAKIPYTTAKI